MSEYSYCTTAFVDRDWHEVEIIFSNIDDEEWDWMLRDGQVKQGEHRPERFIQLRHLGEWSYNHKEEIKSLVALGVVVAAIRDGKIPLQKRRFGEPVEEGDEDYSYTVVIPHDIPLSIMEIIHKIMDRVQ